MMWREVDPGMGIKMKTTCLVGLIALTTGLLLVASGCGHSSKPGQGVDGHWSGFKTTSPDYTCTVDITGNQLEYRGADANDRMRATFILHDDAEPKQMDLTIQEPIEQSNKVILVIYQLDGDTLTVATSSHGVSQRPVDFTRNPQSDVFKFKRD